MDFLGSSSLNRCKKTSLVGVHHHSYTVPRHLPVLCSFIRHIDKEWTRTQPLPLGRQSPASQKEGLFTLSCQRSPIVLVGIFGKGGFVYDREEKESLSRRHQG